MKRDWWDVQVQRALDDHPEGNSDYPSYRDDISQAGNWIQVSIMCRSYYGQQARHLRRLANKGKHERKSPS